MVKCRFIDGITNKNVAILYIFTFGKTMVYLILLFQTGDDHS